MAESIQRWRTPDGHPVVCATWSPGTLPPDEWIGRDWHAPGIGIQEGATMVLGRLDPPLPEKLFATFGGSPHTVRLIIGNTSPTAIAVPPLTITWIVIERWMP